MSKAAPTSPGNTIIAICGLAREANLVGRHEVQCIVSGGIRDLLLQRLSAISCLRIGGIISIGICGALDATLKVGDCVIASDVVSGPSRFAADLQWLQRLAMQLPRAIIGGIAGTD